MCRRIHVIITYMQVIFLFVTECIYMYVLIGTPIFNLRKTWEKLLIAARIIAAIENPTDVCVLSNRSFGQVSGSRFICVSPSVYVCRGAN